MCFAGLSVNLEGVVEMQIHDVHTLSSMPLSGPSYKHPPFRFVDREYLIITYKTDPECLRRAVPEPLQPDPSHTVLYEFIRMPNSYGFGSYTESGIVIPCVFEGEAKEGQLARRPIYTCARGRAKALVVAFNTYVALSEWEVQGRRVG